MEVIVSGLSGFMGQEISKLAENGFRDFKVVGGVGRPEDGDCGALCKASFSELSVKADCIIDFSNHICTHDILEYAVSNALPVVIATTGHTEEERAEIAEAAKKIPIFHAANTSLGVALLIELAKKTAAAMPEAEIEIIEKHHNRKLDAPSGTALAIARAIQSVRPKAFFNMGRSGNAKRVFDEIGIHSIRMGNIVGEHEVIIGTASQTITLKHEAHSRTLFAEGAIVAAQWLVDQKAGLYDMPDMVTF